MSEKVQYIIVAAILVGAIVWIIVGIVRRKKRESVIAMLRMLHCRYMFTGFG